MPESYEKSVKGGTKIKLAPPKSKYVEHILQATRAGDAGVAEIFRTMTNRLRDSTWTIVFKALIIVHLMIREGEPDVTLRYISENPSKLAISSFNDAQDQGRNIRHIHSYLIQRAKAYRDTKTDWVKQGLGRLKRLTVDKGLLRETEIVQKQLKELLKCDLLSDPENEITLTAFRLLTMDLLKLYAVMNEGTINVLEHYFEMSKVDAEKALEIYKTFAKQTNDVVEYLQVARMYEGATRLEIPKLKHAPTGLTTSLSDYLNDPDFDINRRQYLAQQEAKRTGKPVQKIEKTSNTNGSASASGSQGQQKPASGPAPDLIDLFGSLDTNQQSMGSPQQNLMFAPQQQAFQTGFTQPQNNSTNPFAPMVQQQTAQATPGSSYNPFAPQGQPQAQQPFPTGQEFQPQQQQQQPQQQFQDNTNPFGQPPQQQFQSEQNPFGQQQPQMAPMQTGVGMLQGFGSGLSQQAFGQTTQNPQQAGQQFFGQSQSPQQGSPFGQPQQMPQNSLQPLQAQQTSTNPFRQSMLPQATGQASSPFAPQSSAGSNPFARSMNTGMPAIQESSASPFGQPQPQQQQQNSFFAGQQQQSPSPFQSTPQAQPLQPTQTGTNPFARSSPGAQTLSPLSAQATGTNPFRQSQFVNQQTGQSWQNQPQGTLGGMDVNSFQSTQVFPRPPGQ